MTAFSRVQRNAAPLEFTWELRSVNHRFFEIVFRLPETLRELEPRLRDRARARLARGRVEATLKTTQTARELNIDEPTLASLLRLSEQLRSQHPDLGPPRMFDLLNWPGVLVDRAVDRDQLIAAVTTAFDSALAALDDERAREGQALGDAIDERLRSIAHTIDHLTRDASHIVPGLQAKIAARLAELKLDIDPTRLAQEVALLAQRADVAEELERLMVHCNEMQRIIRAPGPAGRRLDFLTQELHREANTLAAKSISAATTAAAVDLKVAIEQIREQVQNVE